MMTTPKKRSSTWTCVGLVVAVLFALQAIPWVFVQLITAVDSPNHLIHVLSLAGCYAIGVPVLLGVLFVMAFPRIACLTFAVIFTGIHGKLQVIGDAHETS